MQKKGKIDALINKYFKAKGNNEHQNIILQIINRHGFYLGNHTLQEMKDIWLDKKMDPVTVASIRQEIFKVFRDLTDPEDKALFEPDIKLEDLQVQGEMQDLVICWGLKRWIGLH